MFEVLNLLNVNGLPQVQRPGQPPKPIKEKQKKLKSVSKNLDSVDEFHLVTHLTGDAL